MHKTLHVKQVERAQNMLATPHIAIVGAGLGGLTLASVLHASGIEATVYDLDASATSRYQGGVLDIHEESGQRALRDAGLFDAFRAIVIGAGDDLRILDKWANVRLDERGDDTRPEVERGALRDLLLTSLPADTVRWGARVTHVEPTHDGGYTVTLSGGDSINADALVGADGAWSKVRPLLSAARPIYSGLSFVEAHLDDADRRHPGSAALVGRGSMFALSDEKGLIAHRNADGRLDVYIALKTPAEWSTSGAIVSADRDGAKTTLLAHFAGWDAGLLALIADADGELTPRPIHALPVGHRWERTRGVTLLGDAAHLMSPFAGEGANLAMLDAAELAAAIVRQPDDIEGAFGTYERSLFPRSEAAAAVSAANLVECFRPDAPQGLVDLITMYQAAG